MIRKNVSRAEILGTLNTLYKESRFDIQYIASQEFFDQILDVLQCKRDYIKIILINNNKFHWGVLG